MSTYDEHDKNQRVFKAKPFKMKSPFVIKRCEKELTIPKEPGLNTQKRAVERGSIERCETSMEAMKSPS